MEAEQVLTYGLVERTAWLLFVNVNVMTAGCAWTALGLWLRWDRVTGDFDVHRIKAVVENSSRQDDETPKRQPYSAALHWVLLRCTELRLDYTDCSLDVFTCNITKLDQCCVLIARRKYMTPN